MARLLLLNGPNLNLLGQREPGVYGSDTLATVVERARQLCSELGHELVDRQSNAEHELIEEIHTAKARDIAFLVFNPGAFTHTSVALHDAIKGTGVTLIELHISNVHAREAFRHHSFISPVAKAVMAGFGVNGYALAIAVLAGMQ